MKFYPVVNPGRRYNYAVSRRIFTSMKSTNATPVNLPLFSHIPAGPAFAAGESVNGHRWDAHVSTVFDSRNPEDAARATGEPTWSEIIGLQ
jgi:hypothetical protein